MSSLEEKIDKKIEEKELKAVKGHEDKAKLKKVELLGIKFITTEKGADLLNEISRVFDLVDVPQKCSNDELQNAENKIRNTVETKNLTFLDGVLLAWNIFEKILDNRLRDENGDPEKGICKGYSYEYLGIINDDVNDLMLNNILIHGYFKHHGEHLHEMFEIGSSAYVRPAWMRSNKN